MCASWWLGSERSATRRIAGSIDTRKPLRIGRSRSTRFMSWPGGTVYGPYQRCVSSFVPGALGMNSYGLPLGPVSGSSGLLEDCANADAENTNVAMTASTTDRSTDTRKPLPCRRNGSQCTAAERCCTVGTMGRGIGAVVAVVALALPAAASADKQVDAAPPNRFTASEYTIDQGEKLVFHNGDTVSHDVTASSKGTDGKPLFNSAVTDSGKSSPVNGAQYLTTGHYEFICSLHANMKATLHVTANGTPATRPGAAGPAGSTQTNSADKTAPALGVRLVSKRLQAVRRGNVLRVRVTVNEESHVVLKAVARPRVGGPLVTVAKAETHANKGTRRVSVPPHPPGGRALRGKRSSLAVIVTVKAIDNAGNKVTVQHGRTPRR